MYCDKFSPEGHLHSSRLSSYPRAHSLPSGNARRRNTWDLTSPCHGCCSPSFAQIFSSAHQWQCGPILAPPALPLVMCKLQWGKIDGVISLNKGIKGPNKSKTDRGTSGSLQWAGVLPGGCPVAPTGLHVSRYMSLYNTPLLRHTHTQCSVLYHPYPPQA